MEEARDKVEEIVFLAHFKIALLEVLFELLFRRLFSVRGNVDDRVTWQLDGNGRR